METTITVERSVGTRACDYVWAMMEPGEWIRARELASILGLAETKVMVRRIADTPLTRGYLSERRTIEGREYARGPTEWRSEYTREELEREFGELVDDPWLYPSRPVIRAGSAPPPYSTGVRSVFELCARLL